MFSLERPEVLFLDRRSIGVSQGRWQHVKDYFLNRPAFGGVVASDRAVAAFPQDQLRETSLLFSNTTRALSLSSRKGTTGGLSR